MIVDVVGIGIMNLSQSGLYGSDCLVLMSSFLCLYFLFILGLSKDNQ